MALLFYILTRVIGRDNLHENIERRTGSESCAAPLDCARWTV